MENTHRTRPVRALVAGIAGVVALGAGSVEATTPPSEPPTSEVLDLDEDQAERDAEFADELSAYDTPLSAAVTACLGVEIPLDSQLHSYDFDVLDAGHSVIMSGINIFDPSLSTGFDAYDCVREQLGLPEWTSEAMGRTTSQFGLVTVELEDGYTVMWSYHPDNGPLVVLFDEEAG